MEITDEEQFVIIKYLHRIGKESEDIQKELNLYFGKNALNYHTISKFILKLRYKPAIAEVEHIYDNTDERLVKAVIRKHCRASIEFICAQTNISYEKVVEIMEHLKLTNAYTRWMPKTFEMDCKLWRVEYCANMLIRYHTEPDFLQKMIIVQEMWLPIFSVKKRSIEYLSLSGEKESPQIKYDNIFHQIIFWDQEGLIYHHSISRENIISRESYKNIIQDHLLPQIAKLRPKLTDKIILHHDSVTLNQTIYNSTFLYDKIESVITPPESPDLFPGDFWFINHVKNAFEGKEFLSVNRLEFTIWNWLREMHSKKTFEYNYKVLIQHWKQCLRSHGECLLNTQW